MLGGCFTRCVGLRLAKSRGEGEGRGSLVRWSLRL